MLKSQASDSDESMQIDTHGPGPSGSGGINQPEVRKKPSKMKNPRNSAGKWAKPVAPSLAIVLIMNALILSH